MRSLQAVATTADRELTDETRRALDLALRYFREAAPKHTADEEESLFPRLRAVQDVSLQNALLELDRLEADHRWAEPLHAAVDDLGKKYLEGGRLDSQAVLSFRNAVQQLSDMYSRHIEVEERRVFPAAAQVLAEDQKQRIAQEMAARRQLAMTTLK